jgi:hypothetical protein
MQISCSCHVLRSTKSYPIRSCIFFEDLLPHKISGFFASMLQNKAGKINEVCQDRKEEMGMGVRSRIRRYLCQDGFNI